MKPVSYFLFFSFIVLLAAPPSPKRRLIIRADSKCLSCLWLKARERREESLTSLALLVVRQKRLLASHKIALNRH